MQSLKKHSVVRTLLLGAVILANSIRAAENDVGAIVRERMAAELLGTEKVSRPDEVDAPADPAQRTLDSQRPDGSWADIAYSNKDRSLWPPIRHIDRVLTLAKAWRTDPTDSAALSGAVKGLEFWLQKDPTSDNWWWNTIGLQQHLVPVVILLRDKLSPEDFREACALIHRSHVDKMTGTNLAWEAGNLFALGALTDDHAAMKSMLSLITHDIAVTPDEGIQADWSFHQHGPQLNAGNYGLGFLETCGRYANFVQGTDLQLSPDKVRILDRFALEFQDWVVWGKYMDLNSCGRQLDQPQAQVRKAAALASECRRLIALDPTYRPPFDALSGRVAGMIPPDADAPVGDRYYWRSDFLVHRPGKWYASVKMYSPRVLRTETAVNSENFKGYHLSDGVTLVMVRGDEYDDIQPVWDWRKLPGVTFRATATPLPYGTKAPFQHNPEAFVGGVSDGSAGASAMDIRKEDVFVHKAWFCFSDGIVCLGSGIRSDGPDTLTTSINQCLLRGSTSVLGENGWVDVDQAPSQNLPPTTRAVLQDKIGYLLLQPSNYVLMAGPQKGSWAGLRKEGVSRTIMAKDVFSLWVDHGSHPDSGSYAYLLLPAVDRAKVMHAVDDPHYTVVSNTPMFQGVISQQEGLFEGVFHTQGKAQLPGGLVVAVDAPCLLLLHLGHDRSAYVSDPTQTRRKLRVQINGVEHTIPLPDGPNAGSTVKLAY